MRHLHKFILFTCLVTCLMLLTQFANAASTKQTVRKPPPVTALVANFYYQDLPAARKWYVDEMGFPVIYNDGWVVIVELGPGMQIALVDGAKGALKAIKDKGAMLAVETTRQNPATTALPGASRETRAND